MHPSRTPSQLENDPLWYKDAIIYEAHVRAFQDSNADGMGDFAASPKNSTIWKTWASRPSGCCRSFPLPGKTTATTSRISAASIRAYGTLRDFQAFLKEAHRRGLRVITELVINHTSDQHEWFQKSRRAEPRFQWRDFYVWSDDPDKYAGTRIIFKDFEPSNWSWDPVAKAYYWHRFFSHQPDLNFDNPLVRRDRHAGARFLGRDGRRRLPSGRNSLPLRARRNQLRKPAGDARIPEGAAASSG